MSYADYERLQTTNLTFSELAKYANRNQSSNISLGLCHADMKSTSIGESSLNGLRTYENRSVSFQEAEGDATIYFSCGYSGSSPTFIIGVPTTDPLGGAFNDTDLSTNFRALTSLSLIEPRVFLWQRTDYPKGSPTGKIDDIWWFEEPVFPFTEIKGIKLYSGGLVHPLSSGTIISTSVGGSPDFSITPVNPLRGVPEGTGFNGFSLQHGLSGIGNYYLYLAVGYAVGSGGTYAYGFNGPYSSGAGSWYGPFSRGSTHTTSFGITMPLTALSTSSSLSDGIGSYSSFFCLKGLENRFLPVDVASGSNNIATFGIEYLVEAWAWVA